MFYSNSWHNLYPFIHFRWKTTVPRRVEDLLSSGAHRYLRGFFISHILGFLIVHWSPLIQFSLLIVAKIVQHLYHQQKLFQIFKEGRCRICYWKIRRRKNWRFILQKLSFAIFIWVLWGVLSLCIPSWNAGGRIHREVAVGGGGWLLVWDG